MKYRCQREIREVDGDQEFEVEADSEFEAFKMFESGKGELVATNCEVTGLYDYDLLTIYEHKQ